MKNLVTLKNGSAITIDLLIAEALEKRLSDVKRTIPALEYWKHDKPILLKQIENLKIIFQLDLFTYENERGIK